MLKKKFRKILALFLPVPLVFLTSYSCWSSRIRSIRSAINENFGPDFELPEKQGVFKKQDPRSFDLYVSEVNAMRLKWFLNKSSLIDLSQEEKNKIYASKLARYYVFDNKNRILADEDKFKAEQNINPTFLKKVFEKAANSYSGDKTNNQGVSNKNSFEKLDNFKIYREISKIFDSNWRFLEVRLIKPGIIVPDKRNYILINAYKIYYTNPVDFEKKNEAEKTENTENQAQNNKNWRIKAPNQKPVTLLRLHWYNKNLENPFKIEFNSIENPNSEYDLQMINDIDQPESIADFNFNFSRINSKNTSEPLEIFHSEPFIRLVSQSFAIPFDGEITDFEAEDFKFKYVFNEKN
ncbi:hypothetical protein [Mesomycoplasma hyopneumoniae]|uniref:hypothetical protein n=1 Tax=Mesomycoplasma hyopneumoniae TaxID=2099 RepID=UPI003877E8EC